MAFEGTLEDFSLAEIFQIITYQKKTGVLTLRSEGKKATIIFKDGDILSAEATDDRVKDMLGYHLIKSGLITNDQLEKALLIQKHTMNNLGSILVNLKFITQEDLQKNLRETTCQKIYKLFSWQNGEYHFALKDIKGAYNDYFKPIPTQSILMEAILITDEWPLMQKKIPSFDIIFDKIRDMDIKEKIQEEEEDEEEEPLSIDFYLVDKAESRDITLSPNEKIVYNTVNGKLSVRGILDHCNLNDFHAFRALCNLLEKNLIYPKEEKRPETAVTRSKVPIRRKEKRIPTALKIALYSLLIIIVGSSIFLFIDNKYKITNISDSLSSKIFTSDISTTGQPVIKKQQKPVFVDETITPPPAQEELSKEDTTDTPAETKKAPVYIPKPKPEEPVPYKEALLGEIGTTNGNLNYEINMPKSPPGPMRVGGKVKPPTLIKSVPPVYPQLARKARIEGIVIIEAFIDKKGNVIKAKVLRSPGGNLGFDRAAIAAVKQWKFNPGTMNNKPVDVIFNLTVRFKL